MATTPLKTASRALSVATVVAALFAVWAMIVPGGPPHAVVSSERPAAKSNADVPTQVVNAKSTAPDATPTKPTSAETARTPASPARTHNKENLPPRGRLFVVATEPNVAVKSDSSDDKLLQVDSLSHDEPADLFPSEPRIQPPLGRPTAGPFATFPSDSSLTTDADRSRESEPQPTLTAKRRPKILDLPEPALDVTRDDNGAARVESQLTAMQRKIDQLAQAQAEQKLDSLQQATQLLQQLQQEKSAEKLDKLLQELRDAKAPSEKPAAEEPDSKPAKAPPKPTDPPETEPHSEDEPKASASKKSGLIRAEPMAGQTERFSIQFQDAEITEALALLGELSGMNILVGRGINGKVPAANLQGVTAEQALDAITKSLGFVYEQEGNFVFVSTAAEALQRQQANRKPVTKVYRPRYISVKELQTLVTPLLSKPTGLIAVTNPSESGLESSRTKAGGDSLSQADALLVVDFPEVIAQVDAVVADIDVPPAQVVIEAMIISVSLTEEMKLGVNFALLNGNNKQLVTSGNGSLINSSVGFPNEDSILPVAGSFLANTAGLKYGFLQGDVSGFIEALEKLTDTSVVASPSVRVLNKQRAELIIGERLGYKTSTFNGTQSIENINFLEVGTKLIIRPYVAEDGLIRMEIHPELSDGEIVDDLPQSRTTEVTSNVMVRDNTTIVIGGLIKEQSTKSRDRVPGLSGLPVVGNLLTNKSNDQDRTELIVLITPRVIRDFEAEAEGSQAQAEHERRHDEFRNKLSRISRTSLANIEYELAAKAFEDGNLDRAKFHVEQSLKQNRNDLQTLRLRDQIETCRADKSWFKRFRRKPQEQYHRVPTDPPGSVTTVPSAGPAQTDAVFEQELTVPSPIPSKQTPPPPAPSVTDDFQAPLPSR